MYILQWSHSNMGRNYAAVSGCVEFQPVQYKYKVMSHIIPKVKDKNLKKKKLLKSNTVSLGVYRWSQALISAAPFQWKFHLQMKHPHLGWLDLIPSCVTFVLGSLFSTLSCLPPLHSKESTQRAHPVCWHTKEKSCCETRALLSAPCETIFGLLNFLMWTVVYFFIILNFGLVLYSEYQSCL